MSAPIAARGMPRPEISQRRSETPRRGLPRCFAVMRRLDYTSISSEVRARKSFFRRLPMFAFSQILTIICTVLWLTVQLSLSGRVFSPPLPMGSLPAALLRPTAMSAQQSGASLNAWLSEMGFVYDPLLRRVRNPFDFLRAEDHPGLVHRCAVSLPALEGILQNQYTVITARQGSGKTALRMIAEDELMKRSSPPLIYTIESSLCNIRVIRDVPRVQRALESKQSVFLFVDTGDTPDRHVVADLLDYVFSEEYFESPIDFKIFLPDGYGALIAPHRTLQIVWMPEQLEQLMQARLRWASDGKRTRLAQICDSALRSQDPDAALARRAHTPRELLNPAQRLFAIHVASGKGEESLLDITDWEMLGKNDPVVLGSPPSSVVPSFKPQSSANTNPLAMRLKLKRRDDGAVEVERLGQTHDEDRQPFVHDSELFSKQQISDVLRALPHSLANNAESAHRGNFTGEEWATLRNLGLAKGTGQMQTLSRR